MKKYFGKLFIPIAWTVFIQVLLCLPGSTLPNTEGILNIPNLDKIAHVIIFGTLVGLWCFYFYLRNSLSQQLKSIFFSVFLLASFNGIIIEYIQKYYIPNRSFDQGDIIADILSAAIAYGICNVKLLL